jgi:hypothetical protein
MGENRRTTYRISEAARELGISAEWLRVGEKRGYFLPALRDRNGQRYYTEEDIERTRKGRSRQSQHRATTKHGYDDPRRHHLSARATTVPDKEQNWPGGSRYILLPKAVRGPVRGRRSHPQRARYPPRAARGSPRPRASPAAMARARGARRWRDGWRGYRCRPEKGP